MAVTVPQEQVNWIVSNQHHDPFEVLGPHQIEEDGKQKWVVRVYLPGASAVSILLPGNRQEIPMVSVYDPHFLNV